MKTILITGAGSGIGKATAEYFANKGWFVVGLDIKPPLSFRDNMLFVKTDISDENEVEKIANELKKEGIRADLLFNCAGILKMGSFLDVDIKLHLQTDAVNFQGILLSVYYFKDLLKKGSVIVNMSSLSAVYGIPELSVYSATKSAVSSLTESLHIEFEKYEINVCDIIAGYVKTPMITSASYKAKSVKKIGFDADPKSIAGMVFKIYNNPGKIHYVVGKKARVFYFLSGLFPVLKRHIVRFLSR